MTQAQTKIDEVRALLAPYMPALTPTERLGLSKMGEKTIGFVENAYDFARQNSGLVPSYLEADAFGVDFADAYGLWTLLNSVLELEQTIDDAVSPDMTWTASGNPGGRGGLLLGRI